MPTDIDTGPGRWALLVIDNEPIRRRLELELQAVRQTIEQCEQEIERHEALDLPAFRQWTAVQCSDLLSERRSLEEEIWRLRARLAAIRGLTQHGIRNVAAAFFWFHEIEQDRASIPPHVQRAWEEVTVGNPRKQRAHRVESEPFEEDSDVQEDPDDGWDADWSDAATDAVSEGSTDRSDLEPGDQRVISNYKNLYRKIELLLHPDLAGVLTKQELELWYQAQRAYAEKDVLALETILARCDRAGTNRLTLSELRAFVRRADSSLATLRQSIAMLAETPSWRFLFLSAVEKEVRLRDVRRELEGINRGLTRELTTIEKELAKIEALTRRWVQRRKGEGKQLALRL
jgi:hypothetical protein